MRIKIPRITFRAENYTANIVVLLIKLAVLISPFGVWKILELCNSFQVLVEKIENYIDFIIG
jgi:hypothetical protein